MSRSTRMLVLGVVRTFGPVHGYDVRRELLSWGVDDWASVATGSIYNALNTLAREAMIEVVGTDQVGGRPERTTYRITAAGEQELTQLMRDAWWHVRTPIDPLAPAVAMMALLPRDEVIAALEARISQIEAHDRALAFKLGLVDDVEIPAHVGALIELVGARTHAELAWARQLIERLRAGHYALAGEPWQAGKHAKQPVAASGAGQPGRAGTSPRARKPAKTPAKAATTPRAKAPAKTPAKPAAKRAIGARPKRGA